MSHDVTVAGYIGVDMAPGFPAGRARMPLSELLRPGKLVETQGLSVSLGGVVANTGLAMKKFGQRVELMGLVGRDFLGDAVVSQLAAHGITSGMKRTRKAGTAYGIVLAPPGMDRMFLEDPGCNNLFTAADIDYTKAARGRLFHFGYPTLMSSMFKDGGVELQALFTRVRKLGVATSLDTTLPDPESPAGKVNWRKVLAGALPQVNIFVPSLEELLAMMEPEEYVRLLAKSRGGDIADHVDGAVFRRMGDKVLALGVSVLMIKAGHRGAYLRTGDIRPLLRGKRLTLPVDNWSHREVRVPAFPADKRKIRNACGAGDCAVAGFLTAMLEGMSLEDAGRCAMLAGRDNLYGVDALQGLRDWKTMKKDKA